MATTRTPGITVDTEGFRTINKEHRGETIFARLCNYVARNASGAKCAQHESVPSFRGH